LGQVLVVGVIALALLAALAFYLIPKIYTVDENLTMLWVPAREQLATQPSTLIHLAPVRRQLIITSIQPTVVLEQPGALEGQSVAQAYYTLQDQGYDAATTLKTMSLGIGHYLDEVRVVPVTKPLTTYQEFGEYLWTAFRAGEGPLSRSEKLSWLFFVQGLAKSQAVSVTVAQPSDWERFYRAMTLESSLKTCTIAVLNASGVNGLASRTARVLENTELTVISITDTPVRSEQTAIIQGGTNPSCGTVVQMVEQMLPVNTHQQVDPVLATEYRADIVLSVGADLAEILGTPPPAQR
jgi:hypothetical protein